MVDEFAAFGSNLYLSLLCVLLFARSMDFLSTWVATPTLMLEANPIAKKMGWRVGLIVNFILAGLFALWPLPAVVVITTSLLVAARNFQSAWIMRSMGEQEYRLWMMMRLSGTPRSLFFFCLFAQTGLVAILGGGLMLFSQLQLVPFAVGLGLVTYSAAILVYSSIHLLRR